MSKSLATDKHSLKQELVDRAMSIRKKGDTNLKPYEIAFQEILEDSFRGSSWWEITSCNIGDSLFRTRNPYKTIDEIMDGLNDKYVYSKEDIITKFTGNKKGKNNKSVSEDVMAYKKNKGFKRTRGIKESYEDQIEKNTIAQKFFTKLVKLENGAYSILRDGEFEKKIFAKSDEEAKEKFYDYINESRRNIVTGKRIVEGVGDDELFFKAFITNLGKYVEGDLVGKYVEFPIDEDDFAEELHSIGVSNEPDADGNYYKEWFVTDYETNLPYDEVVYDLKEYPSYEELQKYGEIVDKVNDGEYDAETFRNVVEAIGNAESAIDALNDGRVFYYSGVSSDGDLGKRVIENMGGLDSLSDDTLETYFDYGEFGEELQKDFNDNYDDSEHENAAEYYIGDPNLSDWDLGEEYFSKYMNSNNKRRSKEEEDDYREFLFSHFRYDAYGRDLLYGNFVMTTNGAVELT